MGRLWAEIASLMTLMSHIDGSGQVICPVSLYPSGDREQLFTPAATDSKASLLKKIKDHPCVRSPTVPVWPR